MWDSSYALLSEPPSHGNGWIFGSCRAVEPAGIPEFADFIRASAEGVIERDWPDRDPATAPGEAPRDCAGTPSVRVVVTRLNGATRGRGAGDAFFAFGSLRSSASLIPTGIDRPWKHQGRCFRLGHSGPGADSRIRKRAAENKCQT